MEFLQREDTHEKKGLLSQEDLKLDQFSELVLLFILEVIKARKSKGK